MQRLGPSAPGPCPSEGTHLAHLLGARAMPRFFMRRYSSPYYSPPRRGYGGRGRSPPRRGYGGYGGKERGSGSLLVRNIPMSCRPEDLRVPFERFGPVRDVYIPKDYYTGEPRGFAFVEFVDPYDASEAQYHMNRQLFGGREITVVVAAESRKRPEEMRKRTRTRTLTFSIQITLTLSPLFFKGPSYSPVPKSRNDHSSSPQKRESSHERSPRNHSKERNEDENRKSYSPSYSDANRNDVNDYEAKASHDAEGSRSHWRRSPRRSSVSPPGSRSRSADLSPRRNSD
ncbi:hypothetical protein MUK42_16466 [Musa troglodytarum]|uniref:RRM domain-containing protein n=1 Tax=Musa troglodytarum TaxID=320322 RepID=A0A9E7HCM8_9LILI|nr:hypothetical protein MUK42_16466 [Musa troglodytarum]